MNNIDKLRKDRFRKSKLAVKRAMLREVVKSIHIHPKNVVRIDLWGSESKSETLRKESLKESEEVLPLLEIGRTLETSFRRHPSKGDRYEAARKAARIGITLLGHDADTISPGLWSFDMVEHFVQKLEPL